MTNLKPRLWIRIGDNGTLEGWFVPELDEFLARHSFLVFKDKIMKSGEVINDTDLVVVVGEGDSSLVTEEPIEFFNGIYSEAIEWAMCKRCVDGTGKSHV